MYVLNIIIIYVLNCIISVLTKSHHFCPISHHFCFEYKMDIVKASLFLLFNKPAAWSMKYWCWLVLRFHSGCNEVVIKLCVVQFWSEIIFVISNRTCAARSFDFKNCVYDFRPICSRLISITIINRLSAHHHNVCKDVLFLFVAGWTDSSQCGGLFSFFQSTVSRHWQMVIMQVMTFLFIGKGKVKVHASQRPKRPELIRLSLAWSMPRSIATPLWTGC